MAPTKAKAKKKKDKKKKDGDTPITVGGGGGRRVKRRLIPFYMDLLFDHGTYIPDPEDQDSHVNPNLILDKVLIRVNSVPTNVPVNGNSEVVIKYKRSGSFNPKMTINGEDAFGVKFKPSHLPFNYSTLKHYAEGLELKKLEIDGREVPLPATRPLTIEAHTKFRTVKRKTKKKPGTRSR